MKTLTVDEARNVAREMYDRGELAKVAVDRVAAQIRKMSESADELDEDGIKLWAERAVKQPGVAKKSFKAIQDTMLKLYRNGTHLTHIEETEREFEDENEDQIPIASNIIESNPLEQALNTIRDEITSLNLVTKRKQEEAIDLARLLDKYHPREDGFWIDIV